MPREYNYADPLKICVREWNLFAQTILACWYSCKRYVQEHHIARLRDLVSLKLSPISNALEFHATIAP